MKTSDDELRACFDEDFDEDWIATNFDAARRVFDLCDELGAAFVKGVAQKWQRLDDDRERPLDNGSVSTRPMRERDPA